MNKTLTNYGTTNPVIVVRRITGACNSLSAPSKDFLKADVRAKKYALLEQNEIQKHVDYKSLEERELKLRNRWTDNWQRGWSNDHYVQKQISKELDEVRLEMRKSWIYQVRHRVLLAQFIAQSYLKRNRKDFR